MDKVVDKRWSYGDAGDRIPVADHDVWRVGDHDFICADVVRDRDLLRHVIADVSMVYVDPPWNAGNARAFRTKAGLPSEPVNYAALIDAVAWLATQATALTQGDIYVEAGVGFDHYAALALNRYGRSPRDRWQITYYRTKPCILLRSSPEPWPLRDLTGVDDEATPTAAMEATRLRLGDRMRVLDLCAGRGLTPRTAALLGHRSVSVELNPRRLAVAIDRVAGVTGATPLRIGSI